jgi:hypothetical protein
VLPLMALPSYLLPCHHVVHLNLQQGACTPCSYNQGNYTVKDGNICVTAAASAAQLAYLL